MAAGEGFNIKKLLVSPLTQMYWVKVIMMTLGASTLLFIGYAVYKAYVKKPDSSQSIVAKKGSVVTVNQINDRKKTLIPFVEGYIDQPSDGNFRTGIRAGIRFEW